MAVLGPDDAVGTDVPVDAAEAGALAAVRGLFEMYPDRVFYVKQVEVMLEDRYFHWVTNRAIKHLRISGEVIAEERTLGTGNRVILLWSRRYRYPQRKGTAVARLVEEMSAPDVGHALGARGEELVLEGFASARFVMAGRETQEYQGAQWVDTEHDLDFIFERDGCAYGVEVKNQLTYLEYEELMIKVDLCREIGVTPVFVVRVLPKSWIEEVRLLGGFTLMLKYHLYPPLLKGLAVRIRDQLGLPAETPGRWNGSTVRRFEKWHEERLGV